MYIRFIIDRLDSQSGRRQGLFQAGFDSRDSGLLTSADEAHLHDILCWFGTNLLRPTRLAVSPRPHREARALSWFKDRATQHVAKIWEFAELLQRYEVGVLMLRTGRPGYVLYEDQHQVAAYPFADTPT